MENIYEISAYKMEKDKESVNIGLTRKSTKKKLRDKFSTQKLLVTYDDSKKVFTNILNGDVIPIIVPSVTGIINKKLFVEAESLYFVLDDKRKKVSKKDVKKYLKENTNNIFIKIKGNESEDKIIERLIMDIDYQVFCLNGHEFKEISEYMHDIEKKKKNKLTTIRNLLKVDAVSSVRAQMNMEEKEKYREKIESLDDINSIIAFINNLKIKKSFPKVKRNSLKLYCDRLASKKLANLALTLDNESLKDFTKSLNTLYKDLIKIYMEDHNKINDNKYMYDLVIESKPKVKTLK